MSSRPNTSSHLGAPTQSLSPDPEDAVPAADRAEAHRLEALRSYDVLDTPPEAIFDELVRMAASVCDTPMAMVSLIDGHRQWFKARVGIDLEETPRDEAFCAHALDRTEPLIVPNAASDPRFAALPLVTREDGIRFYAGAPLRTADGEVLGTLCVIDRIPREMSPQRIETLKLLSRHVMAQLDLRKQVAELTAHGTRRNEQIDALQERQQRMEGLIRDQQARLSQLGNYNMQTGLANRSLFLTRLDQVARQAKRASQPLSVIVLDMQRFHLVSETVGQSHLDELLQQVAQRLIHVFDDPEVIGHLEADRFAAFYKSAATPEDVAALVENMILPALTAPYSMDDRELRVAFKFGIVTMPANGISAEVLLRRAKTALVKAKESDEPYAMFSAELEARVANVVSLETKLRRALEHQEFELHYQPKVSLADGKISGLEALLRWRDPAPDARPEDPGNAWVPPARFVPALEATGLIVDVGRWVLEQAVSDRRDWLKRGIPAPRIAVNISPIQLRHKGFLDDFHAILLKAGHSPGIDVELTEAVLMDHAERCIASLHALRNLGVRIAIDDFGSGYSSLRYIARLPIDALKIDMAFVHAMPKGPDNLSIVSSIIALAHGLRVRTVAEGVETEEQKNLLRLLRCDEIQGYLVAKPQPMPVLERMLAPPEP